MIEVLNIPKQFDDCVESEEHWFARQEFSKRFENGFCYLNLFELLHQEHAERFLGAFPDVGEILRMAAGCFRQDLKTFTLKKGPFDVWHVQPAMEGDSRAHVQLAIVSTGDGSWPKGSMGSVMSDVMADSFGITIPEEHGLSLCDMVGADPVDEVDSSGDEDVEFRSMRWRPLLISVDSRLWGLAVGVTVRDFLRMPAAYLRQDAERLSLVRVRHGLTKMTVVSGTGNLFDVIPVLAARDTWHPGSVGFCYAFFNSVGNLDAGGVELDDTVQN